MVGGTGRKGVRVRRLAVTDRGDEPVFIVGLFCIPDFVRAILALLVPAEARSPVKEAPRPEKLAVTVL